MPLAGKILLNTTVPALGVHGPYKNIPGSNILVEPILAVPVSLVTNKKFPPWSWQRAYEVTYLDHCDLDNISQSSVESEMGPKVKYN